MICCFIRHVYLSQNSLAPVKTVGLKRKRIINAYKRSYNSIPTASFTSKNEKENPIRNRNVKDGTFL